MGHQNDSTQCARVFGLYVEKIGKIELNAGQLCQGEILPLELTPDMDSISTGKGGWTVMGIKNMLIQRKYGESGGYCKVLQ